jgi:hypothetical protein
MKRPNRHTNKSRYSNAKKRAGSKTPVEVETTDKTCNKSGICKYESVLHGCLNHEITDCMCYNPKTCKGFTR